VEDFISFLFDFVGDVIGDGIMFLLFEKKPSKKRINKTLDHLKTESWFKVLYENPNYKKSLLTNESVRIYIGEKGAKRIKKSEKLQQKLTDLLQADIVDNGEKLTTIKKTL
jgi:hypothetical protein